MSHDDSLHLHTTDGHVDGLVAKGSVAPERDPLQALRQVAQTQGQQPAGAGKVAPDVAKPAEPESGIVLPTRSIPPYERQVGNWLNAYMEYTKESESPDSYHLWVGLWCLSSVIRRNVYKDQGLYVLFPNLFVTLVGPPARTAKSTAINFGTTLLRQVSGVKFGPNAGSKEQIIRAMAEAKLNNVCAMSIASSEFSSLIDTSGILMIQFLTDIFDGNYIGNEGWKYETKHQGKDNLVNPVLNLLVGTTPSYLAESMPDNVVGHGYTSRTIFIHEELERLIAPIPPALDSPLARGLVEDLRHIGVVRGMFDWGGDLVPYTGTDPRWVNTTVPNGLEAYDSFYRGLYKNPPEDHRIAGYHWRKKIHVLKVAMLLSLAEDDSLLITKRDVDAAAQLLDNIEPNMARAFSAVGKYEHAADVERIGEMIQRQGKAGMNLEEVYQKNYWAGNTDEVGKMIGMLSRMGTIKVENKGGKEWAVPQKAELPWNASKKKK